MATHAESQISDAEAIRLMMLALRSPDHAATYELVRGAAITSQEMIGRWTLDTPEGPLHRVAEVRVLDGEPSMEFFYRDEADAIAVWDHVVAEREALRPRRSRK